MTVWYFYFLRSIVISVFNICFLFWRRCLVLRRCWCWWPACPCWWWLRMFWLYGSNIYYWGLRRNRSYIFENADIYYNITQICICLAWRALAIIQCQRRDWKLYSYGRRAFRYVFCELLSWVFQFHLNSWLLGHAEAETDIKMETGAGSEMTLRQRLTLVKVSSEHKM